ncbi:uncharacterized protein LOC133411664 isoform X3 [Phycodurus eques]|uniref:uncharacterized protein LOC133411664 isoform X3 n=1 Tax=Phycodurus eques TaxID=693459 RepID=UPI002ACE31D8|nr:uncharacterized protein LOC133411664 isoform X3 [Phycodurus eques]
MCCTNINTSGLFDCHYTRSRTTDNHNVSYNTSLFFCHYTRSQSDDNHNESYNASGLFDCHYKRSRTTDNHNVSYNTRLTTTPGAFTSSVTFTASPKKPYVVFIEARVLSQIELSNNKLQPVLDKLKEFIQEESNGTIIITAKKIR